MKKLKIGYPFDLHHSLKKLPLSQILPCSALFNDTIIGGFLFTCSPADFNYFGIAQSTSPQPGFKFRMVDIKELAYLIEIHLVFDADRILKFHLDPVHPTVKVLFDLLKTEKKIAFHFYNKQTDVIASAYTEMDDEKVEWLIRNIKLANKLKINPYYSSIEENVKRSIGKNDKLFMFNGSNSIEQSFILENCKVVQAL